MLIQTSRFGTIDLSPDDLIEFPEGILGFNELRKFVLLDDPHDEIFAWLQSCETPGIAFPVLEPELFAPAYVVSLTRHDLEALKLPLNSAANEPGSVPLKNPLLHLTRNFSIITIPEDPTQMTANLKAPIVINIQKKVARQCVLQDNTLAIREPIFIKLQQRVVQNPQGSLKSQASDWGVAIKLPEKPIAGSEVSK
jgi:flagellar assembly factor FliW